MRSLKISTQSYSAITPVNLGSDLESFTGSLSTAVYENDLSFTQAAQSAELKYGKMFGKKLNFKEFNINSPQPKGNKSHAVIRKNSSMLTFEEKFNVDHNSILGEGASC